MRAGGSPARAARDQRNDIGAHQAQVINNNHNVAAKHENRVRCHYSRSDPRLAVVRRCHDQADDERQSPRAFGRDERHHLHQGQQDANGSRRWQPDADNHFDLDTQKLYAFDSKKKQADVYDMATFAAEIAKTVDMSAGTMSFTGNGQTKEIAGHTAAGYDVEISTRAGMGGSAEMMMTVTLVGPVWMVEEAPGAADYARFYSAAVEKGWIFSDPRAAQAQPGQAKAMAEMYRQIAAVGGIPYETNMEMKLSGSGPMAAMMARMGGANFTTVIDAVETVALSDDLFVPPADYKLEAK